MTVLARTLAIVAFLVLATQTVRHAYLLWFEPRQSVLDKFDRPLKEEISSARNLEELLNRYEPARKQADEARRAARNAPRDARLVIDEEADPFKSERVLHEAIRDWEAKSREVHAVRFYWSVGFLLFAIGYVVYLRLSRWAGLMLQIAAFSEFLYWTSPTFIGSAAREVDRLLAYKLALSLASLLLLALTMRAQRLFSPQKP